MVQICQLKFDEQSENIVQFVSFNSATLGCRSALQRLVLVISDSLQDSTVFVLSLLSIELYKPGQQQPWCCPSCVVQSGLKIYSGQPQPFVLSHPVVWSLVTVCCYSVIWTFAQVSHSCFIVTLKQYYCNNQSQCGSTCSIVLCNSNSRILCTSVLVIVGDK